MTLNVLSPPRLAPFTEGCRKPQNVLLDIRESILPARGIHGFPEYTLHRNSGFPRTRYISVCAHSRHVVCIGDIVSTLGDALSTLHFRYIAHTWFRFRYVAQFSTLRILLSYPSLPCLALFFSLHPPSAEPPSERWRKDARATQETLWPPFVSPCLASAQSRLHTCPSTEQQRP